MNRDFKGVWIPKEIYLNKYLNWTEKILLVEIDSLDGEDGCFASNEHFAEHLMISKDRVSKIINKLVKEGYVTSNIIYKKGTKQIEKRILSSTIGYSRKYLEGTGGNADRGIGENDRNPIGVNDQDNNTSFNNTSFNNTTIKTKEEKINDGCSSNNETELNNFKLYEMLGFGTLNSVTMADIKILEEQYTKKWVEEALKEANDQGTRTMKYVKGILKNWKVTGIKKSKDKDNSSSNNQSSYRNPKPTEVFNSQMYEEFNPNEEIPDYDTVYRETCERMRRKREAEYKKKQITT